MDCFLYLLLAGVQLTCERTNTILDGARESNRLRNLDSRPNDLRDGFGFKSFLDASRNVLYDLCQVTRLVGYNHNFDPAYDERYSNFHDSPPTQGCSPRHPMASGRLVLLYHGCGEWSKKKT